MTILESGLQSHGLQLDTQARFIALQGDPNTEFTPFTRLEATQALGLLGFMNKLKSPSHAVGKALSEIIQHQVTHEASNPRMAAVSVVHQFGDFAINARNSLASMTCFMDELNEEHLFPKPTLSEEFPDGHKGIPPLVRFLDARYYRDEGRTRPGLLFDGFRGVTYGLSKEEKAVFPGRYSKRKAVQDPYTATLAVQGVADRISGYQESTRIGDVRRPLRKAIANERMRAKFWTETLERTSIHGAVKSLGKIILRHPRVAE